MHPRMLARHRDCSGGTCPAVYDLPGQPGDLVIQGKKADAALLARLTGVAPDETAVTIPREIIREALTPPPEPVTAAALQAQLAGFSHSAFRLETLQRYAATGRDDQWITLLRANRRWGKTHQRVHIVREPLTAAMQEELTAGYEGNVTAGEDIRIIPVPGGAAWPPLPAADFWLLDSARLYLMSYAPGGAFTGASRVRDPAGIAAACAARDTALHIAIPWRAYIDGQPGLRRKLAQ